MCYATVGDIRDRNPKCRDCRFAERCTGGCRNSALMVGNDYYALDPEVCAFFENGWDVRIRQAAEPAFAEYIRRNPPLKPALSPEKEEEEAGRLCEPRPL